MNFANTAALIRRYAREQWELDLADRLSDVQPADFQAVTAECVMWLDMATVRYLVEGA